MALSEKERLDFLFAEVAALKFFVGTMLTDASRRDPDVELALRVIADGLVPNRDSDDRPPGLSTEHQKTIDEVVKRENDAIKQMAREFHRQLMTVQTEHGRA